jgi:hypothetical protein
MNSECRTILSDLHYKFSQFGTWVLLSKTSMMLRKNFILCAKLLKTYLRESPTGVNLVIAIESLLLINGLKNSYFAY